ncbi:MAG: S9 family peptidase [Burkholderiales bacterium]|nr:S9 family peptidase [Burkholderiales bacterium]
MPMNMPKTPPLPPPRDNPADTAATTEDPYLWLEEVQGERALAWVRERNAESEARLRADPGFDALRTRLREVLDSPAQIPYVSRLGPWLYNLWRDAANPRGVWRRTSLEQYRQAEPAWETVLDLDALGRAEGKSWVWGGATPLGPEYRRCLLSLSIGGADASVVREFDLVDKRFVEPAASAASAGGFHLPEAKSRVEWIDIDTLYVGTDFGPGSLTDSGYPRLVKRWRRGQPLAEAVTVFAAEKTDISAWVSVDLTPGFERTTFGRQIDFYRSKTWLLEPATAGAPGLKPSLKPSLKPIDKPDDATLAFWREHVLIELRSDWAVAGRTPPPTHTTHRAGSLLLADADAFLAGERRFTVLFAPTATRSLAGWTTTRRTVIVNVMDNVASKLEEWRWRDGGQRSRDGKISRGAWVKRDVQAPYPGTLSVSALHDPLLEKGAAGAGGDPLAEHYLLSAADFLEPDSLQLGRTGSDERERLKARPRFFDAEGMRAEQRFATSRDGTRVPYFVVWPQGATANGDNPTLLYGYGGFEVAMQPSYSGTLGRAWTTRGGVYVLANIRGGGEFGPAWHQAALKAQRQKSYDDFIAVAEDLIAQRITRPARLGIQGGSNGGLLVGAVMLQRPELFGAVVCQVPLLDMRRYHKLLAGASWMAEYGDPDDAAEWAFIRAYSPYHNVPPAKAGASAAAANLLPPVLIDTSTRDDRVHPGHARKFAAHLAERGHRPLYWENLEGGHGGAADNAQRSLMMALEYTFLWQTLMGEGMREGKREGASR